MEEKTIIFNDVAKKYLYQEDKTFKEFLHNLLKGKISLRRLTVFENISFDIKKGEVVGIIGKNGAGKSTLLKLIAGVSYPTTGEIKVNGRVAPLIELGAGFHPELSGYENIFLNAAILGLHKKEIELKIKDIIDFSELKDFIHTPLKKYSSGMQMRLAFSVAISVDADILLIDEILSVGDAAFQKKCLDYLQALKKKGDRTIIFVSHSENSVKSFCDRVLLLDHGKLIADGSPQHVFQDYHHILNN